MGVMPEIRRIGMRKQKFDRTPTAFCSYCNKEYKLTELRIINATPKEQFYICEKCDYKRKMRKSLGMKT